LNQLQVAGLPQKLRANVVPEVMEAEADDAGARRRRHVIFTPE